MNDNLTGAKQNDAPSPWGDRRSVRRLGFSFVEVLFAVMILGIGFIMIAGVFPVAISQTASTQEETIGSALIHDGVAAITAIPKLDVVIPANGEVMRFTNEDYWGKFKGNQVFRDDPRYAWIPLLRRGKPNSVGVAPATAQLIVIPVQIRGRSQFGIEDFRQNGTGDNATANLMPLRVKVTLTEGGNNADSIVLNSGAGVQAAAPGAVIVISDPAATDNAGMPMAGRVYRLGVVDDTNASKYTLLPGNDMPKDPVTGQSQEKSGGGPVDAYIVGKGLDPAANLYSGPSMAFGVYVTYISLK